MYRLAKAIQEKKTPAEIIPLAEEWIEKTRILVDIQTLEYMVRGGRVSALKGFLAKILNMKPIVSLDREGKAIGYGKSFSRRQNMKKIIRMIQKMHDEDKIWNYSIVHAQNEDRARMYAQRLTKILNKGPLYVMDISPVIGVHNGIGAVGIGLMYA